MTYKIEKRIPMPEKHKGRKLKYDFCKMEIGDSFFVPPEDIEKTIHAKQGSILVAARKHKPKKFITMEKNGGIRVWRVK